MTATAKIVRINWQMAVHRGIDCTDLSAVVCPECPDTVLTFDQPDPDDEDPVLTASCGTCRGLYLCDRSNGVLIDLDRIALLEGLRVALKARDARNSPPDGPQAA
jgi:hypothetical protein